MADFAQVIVAGAGPTGLFVAGELARRGVQVRLIEKHRHRQDISKALVIQARTLEIMDISGLADKFVSRGYPAPGLNMSLDNKRPVSVDMRRLQTRFPYLLVLPQQETEAILEAHLVAHGGRIERGIEAVRVEQESGRVRTTVRSAEAADQRVLESDFLVACDGTHSTVRQALGVPFEGKEQDYIVFLADVKIDARFNNARITNFTSRRGFLSILPFLGEYSRIFAVDFEKQKPSAHEPLSLPDLQDTVDAIAPKRLRISESRWITRFRSPSRQVPSARSSRVFFVGDAAHSHSPAGGQGMNNGLQDAANLAWKLATVVRREGPEALLDTYDRERHRVDAEAQKKTDLMFKSFTLSNPMWKLARDIAIRTLIPIEAVQQRLAGDLSGISISYDFAAVPARNGRQPRLGLRAGARVPDCAFWSSKDSGVRMFELLRCLTPSLFVYATALRMQDEAPKIQGLFEALARRYGARLQTNAVVDEGIPSELRDKVLLDFKNDFYDAMRPACGETFLIRPDGYLAFRCSADASNLDRLMSSWVSPIDRTHGSQVGG